jgi:hypothetical protein
MSEELSEISRTLESDRGDDGEQVHGVGKHDKYKWYSQMKEPKPHVGDVDTRYGGNYDQTKNDYLRVEADTDVLKPLLSAARYHRLDEPHYSLRHNLAADETLE